MERGVTVPRPPKTFTIPLYDDIKCIATLEKEGYTQRQMAEYYQIPLGSLTRYYKKYKERTS